MTGRGQNVPAKIVSEFLRKMVYDIEYISAAKFPQHAVLSQGNLQFQADVRRSNVGDRHPKAVGSGEIIELGSLVSMYGGALG